MYLLHEGEKSFARGLRFDRRRHSYLLGRVSAKYAFKELIKNQSPDSVFIDYGIFQFPVLKYVKDGNKQVCISHCDNIGLALVYPEEHPLGIDIEKIESKIVDTLTTQLTAEEKALLRSNNFFNDVGHTLIWTVKEALSKIFRTGLMMDFQTLEVESIKQHDGYFESSYKHCAQYKAISMVKGVYACTITVPKNTSVDLSNFRNAFQSLAH